MKHAIIVALALLQFQSAFAQISNVKTKISDEQDKVTITYDLARNPKITFYNIKLRIVLDGEVVTATGLSGDIGPQVTAGFGKKVVWDVTKDLAEISGELKIDVQTDTKAAATNCKPINAVPAYAGLGGVGISGLGLLISGLSLSNKSNELYDIYKTKLNPSDAVYSDLSRDDHYAEANKKHKISQGLTGGGIAILVVGGATLISRTIKIRKYNRHCAGLSSNEPRLRVQPMTGTLGAASTVGIGLSYKF